MYEPIRGGTRGGQGEFKWSDVGADKDRENYLGHSINAPTGRWQKNKDVHWYNRDQTTAEDERREEIRKVKEAEADALAVALGFDPAPKGTPEDPTAAVSGSNAVAVAINPERAEAQRVHEKAQRKAEKEAKRVEKDLKRAEKAKKKAEKREIRRDRERSRSRSPRRMEDGPERRRRDYSRSRSPAGRRSRSPPRRREGERSPGARRD